MLVVAPNFEMGFLVYGSVEETDMTERQPAAFSIGVNRVSES